MALFTSAQIQGKIHFGRSLLEPKGPFVYDFLFKTEVFYK